MEKIIIVAATTNDVIGRDNRLLWRLSGDMQFFKAQTTGHAVIMGRKTFESMGRPLPNRTNIVITRDTTLAFSGCTVVHSLEEAFAEAGRQGATKAFVIGGGEIYRQAWHQADTLLLTRVHTVLEGDTYIPFVDDYWQETESTDYTADAKNEYDYTVVKYIKSSLLSG